VGGLGVLHLQPEPQSGSGGVLGVARYLQEAPAQEEDGPALSTLTELPVDGGPRSSR
jgi:hypothetical protein